MMSKNKRNHRSPEEKAELLRRHFVDKEPVSKICEEIGLQPSVFYHWQRELFVRAPQALGSGSSSNRGSSREKDLERKVAALEAKLAKKDRVIAEISAEYVDLKKELGEP
jgi:transposase-like protein